MESERKVRCLLGGRSQPKGEDSKGLHLMRKEGKKEAKVSSRTKENRSPQPQGKKKKKKALRAPPMEQIQKRKEEEGEGTSTRRKEKKEHRQEEKGDELEEKHEGGVGARGRKEIEDGPGREMIKKLNMRSLSVRVVKRKKKKGKP